MRNVTRNVATVLGLGVLGISYSVGATAQVSGGFDAAGVPNTTTDAGSGNSGNTSASVDGGSGSSSGAGATGQSGGVNPGSTKGGSSNSAGGAQNGGGKSGSGSTSGSGAGSSSAGQTGANSGSGSTSGTGGSSGAGSTPAPTQSSSSSGSGSSGSGSSGSSAPSPVTKTGSAINYQFGTIQVSVTKTGGKITDITYLQSTATHGRDQAFPYLVSYAIQAQGTGFGNMSGATYTTDAFKQALNSALGKF